MKSNRREILRGKQEPVLILDKKLEQSPQRIGNKFNRIDKSDNKRKSSQP